MALASTLKTESEAGKAVQPWINQLELQAGARAKRVRCDRAVELVSAEMWGFCTRQGICLEKRAVHTPQQNGKTERLNRILMERVRFVLVEAGLDKQLWAEPLIVVVYTPKRAPTSGGKAPLFERFQEKKPYVACLRRLGSLAYALMPKEQQRKLQPKTMLGRCMGYAAGGHAYRVYKCASRIVVGRRDVVADVTPVVTNGHSICLSPIFDTCTSS